MFTQKSEIDFYKDKLSRIRGIIEEQYIEEYAKTRSVMEAFADGGCSENGVGGAYGSYKIGDGEIVTRRYPGLTTNNQAEYETLIGVLNEIRSSGLTGVNVYMDSQLVVNQVNRKWKIKEQTFKPYAELARKLLKETSSSLTWVNREQIVHVLGH